MSKRYVPYLTGLALVVGLLIAVSSLPRGFWLDEFDVQTRGGLSPGQYLSALVHFDAHPLVYTGLVYGAQSAGITDPILLRCLNFIGVPWALWPLWICWRRNVLSLTEICVAIAIYASSLDFLNTFADVRPYFLLSAASLAVAAAWLLMLRADVARGAREPLLIWALCLGVFVNLHYFATLFGGLLTVLLLLRRARERQWRSAALIAGISFLVALPALVTGAMQDKGLMANNSAYWYHAGAQAAGLAILSAFFAAGAMNVPAAACAIIGAYRELGQRAARSFLSPQMILIAAAAIFFAALFLAHLIKPIIEARYLAASSGAVVLALTMFTCAPTAPKWAPLAACVTALLLQGLAVASGATSRDGWKKSAQAVADLTADCSATHVYTVPFARVYGDAIGVAPLDPIDLAGRRLGYRYYASHLGFAYSELKPGDVVPAPADCPSVIWFEHFWPKVHDNAQDVLQPLSLRAAGETEIQQINDGAMIVLVQPAK